MVLVLLVGLFVVCNIILILSVYIYGKHVRSISKSTHIPGYSHFHYITMRFFNRPYFSAISNINLFQNPSSSLSVPNSFHPSSMTSPPSPGVALSNASVWPSHSNHGHVSSSSNVNPNNCQANSPTTSYCSSSSSSSNDEDDDQSSPILNSPSVSLPIQASIRQNHMYMHVDDDSSSSSSSSGGSSNGTSINEPVSSSTNSFLHPHGGEYQSSLTRAMSSTSFLNSLQNRYKQRARKQDQGATFISIEDPTYQKCNCNWCKSWITKPFTDWLGFCPCDNCRFAWDYQQKLDNVFLYPKYQLLKAQMFGTKIWRLSLFLDNYLISRFVSS